MLQTAQARRRAVLLLGSCAVLAVLASSSFTHDALLQMLGATKEVIERYPLLGPVTFVVIAAVSAMLAFVSVAVVVPAAVFAWGAPVSIGLLWLTADRALLKLEGVYLGNNFVAGRSGPILAIGAAIALGSVCAVSALRRLMVEAR